MKKVLFIHGFSAKKEDNEYFIKYLKKHKNIKLNTFILPGHSEEKVTYVTYQKWLDKAEKEFSQIAKDNSDGDIEVESTIYSSLCSAFNDNADRMNMFYQSAFLMCYSYYESCVAQLSKNTKTKEAIQAICKSKNISLSEESLNAIDYLQNDINDLRNNICHNNFGTYRKIDSLKRLSELNVGFDFDGNTLFFTNPKLIIDALDKMHAVLNELCDKLGYKTVIVGKKNPC